MTWSLRAGCMLYSGVEDRVEKRVAKVRVTFLLDVDNTLLDNDRVVSDFADHFDRALGRDGRIRYWLILEQLRLELGYADYLGALQRYRTEHLHDLRVLNAASFLLDYPFADRLYPASFDVVNRLKKWGSVVVVTDGDAVFQPRKVERSGLADAVGGDVLIYVHKEQELLDIARRFPAEHYVFVDDKPRILEYVKRGWGSRVTTVLPRQGHYALDPDSAGFEADVTIDGIGDLLLCDLGNIGNAGDD